MPPTLGAVLRARRLHLRLLTDDTRLDNRVRWVAVSELTDPTPYLAGGELVLTTGVRWQETTDLAAYDYVRRLVEHGATALGFGTGVVHEAVPAELLAAARELGLPLLEVPLATPFIAVGEEVSRLVAREEYEGLTRAFDAQRRLTEAALRGERAVVDTLAEEVDRWALLFAPDGELRHAAPESVADRSPALAAEVRALRGARRPTGVSVTVAGDSVALQPLGVGERGRAVLAVGGPRPLETHERTLVNAAVSLLSLELARTAPERRVGLRAAVLTALLAGAIDLNAAARLREALPTEPVVLALAPAATLQQRWPAQLAPHLAADIDDRVVVLGTADSDPAAGLAALTGGPVGAAEPAEYTDLPGAWTRAEAALGAAQRAGAGLVRYRDAPGGLMGLLATPEGLRRAHELLAPLASHRSSAELVASLRAYLAAAGRWDAAAESLRVHRHTLRYRIARIRELLPGDLDDPDYRAELWLALRVARDSPDAAR
ncbi:PucR family transcriptional regulator [Salinactinospora qingdaonensis]|uniref:PucR family transcriptional regulator n=1 Tax=Salinactinospora qingdaonensis TaxID=702744 RepID=A0ABP7FQI4_9ACTN